MHVNTYIHTYVSRCGAIKCASWTQTHDVDPPTYINLRVAILIHQPRTHRSKGGVRVEWKRGPYIPMGRASLGCNSFQFMNATCPSDTCMQYHNCTQTVVRLVDSTLCSRPCIQLLRADHVILGTWDLGLETHVKVVGPNSHAPNT